MSESAAAIRRAARACQTCAQHGTWEDGRLVDPFIPQVDLGHDTTAHRIYNMLLRAGIKTAPELATYRDVELLRVVGISSTSLARIRAVLPEPDDEPDPSG